MTKKKKQKNPKSLNSTQTLLTIAPNAFLVTKESDVSFYEINVNSFRVVNKQTKSMVCVRTNDH